jgi:hypothetical protein
VLPDGNGWHPLFSCWISAGASADEAAATIDKDARARWNTWDNAEWISFAARTFYDSSTRA